ncbi:MAG: hypothetical protein ACI9AU_000065 [Bacteroidia bacterium]|jgi:hypothetical protein
MDLFKLYILLNDIFVTYPGTHTAAFGSGDSLTSGVYATGSAGSLTLDGGGGDTNAVFIIKFEGARTAAASSTIVLNSGTRSSNVYWIAEGAISIGANSVIKGNLFAHPGAVTLGAGCDIEGRLLTSEGAITFGTDAIIPTDPITIPIRFSSNRPPSTAVGV